MMDESHMFSKKFHPFLNNDISDPKFSVKSPTKSLVMSFAMGLIYCLSSVSYTHLTLPTKRIV